MDTPLLALTRRKLDLGPSPDTMADNLRQLTQLRWLAVGGQFITILVVRYGFRVPLPLAQMLGIVALLAAVNLITLIMLTTHRVTNLEITIALLIDMAALAFQLYLSGGTSNPFSLLFLLQVVLGAILLQAWSVWLLGAAAMLCYGLLGLRHEPLLLPNALSSETSAIYTFGGWLAFAMLAVLLTLFIGRISSNLRTRDTYVSDLQRRTAEEEGIVRMGLFASGAAHELGTPLATLSVILGDWRRLPQISSDPELAAELEDMRSEVERCKSIVSDILRSAGEPRGEPMARIFAGEFLSSLASEWRLTYPRSNLRLDIERVGSATLAAEPQLRQALWNLLENAAEVSPDGMELSAERHGGTLTLSVRDQGSGFTNEQIEQLGRPIASSKGAGHGVGLFLAANVARQLGGRLVASDLPGGGAEVRIELRSAEAIDQDDADG